MGKYSNLVKSAASDSDQIKFVFIKGKYSGGEFSIREGQRLSIGRDISCDVAIVDSKVSRNHASITSRGGNIFIEDHNSTNGTYLNGEKLSPSTETPLKNGYKISVGDSTILVGGEAAAEEKPEVSLHETSFTAMRKAQEVTMPSAPAEEPEEEAFTLDESLQVVTPKQPETQPAASHEEEKFNIAKVSLKRASQSDIAKDNLMSANSSSTGNLSAMDIADLLKILAQSASAGYLKLNITSPFAEQIEVTISATGIVACESITNKEFSQEKALSRALLAKDGEYSFKIDAAPKNEAANNSLEDLFMEISNQKENLAKYRNAANAGRLELLIPIKGKLSDLSKTELDTLQFMINSKETVKYLNAFQDNDDFILLSEIVKFMDLGFLTSGKKFDDLADDILSF